MKDNSRINRFLYIIGVIPVVWLALLVAPYINGGLFEIVNKLPEAINSPFRLIFCNNSIKISLFFVLIYIFAIGLYETTKKNYRHREEHGSAKWGNAKSVNKKYKQNPSSSNKILTQNVAIGLDGKKHRRNLNVLVCGRFWCR